MSLSVVQRTTSEIKDKGYNIIIVGEMPQVPDFFLFFFFLSFFCFGWLVSLDLVTSRGWSRLFFLNEPLRGHVIPKDQQLAFIIATANGWFGIIF